MWKYVSRRIKDTFERSVNHFDRRSTTGVVNSATNVHDDSSKRSAPPCRWFCPRKCWSSSQGYNDTNSKQWNFEDLNRTWIGAITWSSALVLGWYTSQLIHLKLKHRSREHLTGCASIQSLLSSFHPYVTFVKENPVQSKSKIQRIIANFTPTVHLISNEHVKNEKSTSDADTSPDTSNDDLGEVLNSIENRLGLAAIENGQHQDGINLLRSAANRNHAPALYNLGLCYEMGLGVSVDEKCAMELYRLAAALEHPGALYNLGVYYGQGRGGLHRDTATAIRLLKLAAVQGQKDAVNALKTLDDSSVPPPDHTLEPWTYHCSPYLQTDIIPTQSTLFVENVNYFQKNNFNTIVY